MDAGDFDGLVRSLTARGTRRGVLGLLRTLPLIGGAVALVGTAPEATARRKKARQHRPGAAKQRRKGKPGGKGKHQGKGKPTCRPEPIATTCAGKCGPVKNTCQKTVDCGPCREGLTCAACAALDNPDFYDRAADCCGEMVCDCGQLEYYPGDRVVQCKRPGVCRPNHVPVALNLDVKHLKGYYSYQSGYPVVLGGYEPDFEEFVHFRIVEFPQHGFLTLANEVFIGEPGTSALPAPPIPADAQLDCKPRCLPYASDMCTTLECPDCSSANCPEGHYFNDFVNYVTYSETFTGIDSFTYAAVDGFGAEGPPAMVTITIFET